MTARPDWTAAQAEQAQRDLKRDPAGAAYWIWLKARREAEARKARA
ncbi:MAG: hypothetical protein K2X91_14400 [Thermoleophilia bacterium]|nr:hypothetical protein [Thermoleophilia bacterium]